MDLYISLHDLPPNVITYKDNYEENLDEDE